MCPIYTSCFTAPVNRFFSTGVGGTTILKLKENLSLGFYKGYAEK